MDNVLLVVEDVEATRACFAKSDELIGLTNVRATLAMKWIPDGQGTDLDKFHPPHPVHSSGLRRVRAKGAEVIGELRQWETPGGP